MATFNLSFTVTPGTCTGMDFRSTYANSLFETPVDLSFQKLGEREGRARKCTE